MMTATARLFAGAEYAVIGNIRNAINPRKAETIRPADLRVWSGDHPVCTASLLERGLMIPECRAGDQ